MVKPVFRYWRQSDRIAYRDFSLLSVSQERRTELLCELRRAVVWTECDQSNCLQTTQTAEHTGNTSHGTHSGDTPHDHGTSHFYGYLEWSKVPKWPFLALFTILDNHENDLYHGHVGCPLKTHQKCSTKQKTRGQNVDPIKNYSPNTFVWIFCLINHNVRPNKTSKASICQALLSRL